MSFKQQFIDIVNIRDYVDTEAAAESIKSNIYFKGPNAWILAFSIIIASVGLNVNSIPVIIGAMLISPLMGPIFGVGLGLGTKDMTLIKESLRNLLVMVGISLAASVLYFVITPLNLTNPTELLARTNPTIYDVLIALFGGFAGIFELCRKSKGTVFSGVAIATALMPPLCTAGFGIASGNLGYFLGAFYLFIINCLFITLATYITVRYLKFPETEYADQVVGRRTKRIITVTIILFIIPSLWSAVAMIKHSNFEQKATAFIEENKIIGNAFIYDYNITHNDGSKVEVYLTGEPLSETNKQNFYSKAKEFDLERECVVLNEYVTEKDDNSDLLKTIYEQSDEQIRRLREENRKLQQELEASSSHSLPYVQITREIKNSYPGINSVILSQGAMVTADSLQVTEQVVAIVKTTNELTEEEETRLNNWLKIRLNTEEVILHWERTVTAVSVQKDETEVETDAENGMAPEEKPEA